MNYFKKSKLGYDKMLKRRMWSSKRNKYKIYQVYIECFYDPEK